MLTLPVDKFTDAVRTLLAPVRCQLCGRQGASVCAPCAASLPWNACACRTCASPLSSPHSATCANCMQSPPPQDSTWAAFRYEPPVVQQIVKLKFHGDLLPAHFLGALMAHKLAERREPLPELLVPVPLHAGRLRRRGYNQALEIGRQLARILAIPLDAMAAQRRTATREQTALSAVDRRRNVRGVFSAGPQVSGKRIALLDDVITTGATVAELARSARIAGAAQIEVWAAARA